MAQRVAAVNSNEVTLFQTAAAGSGRNTSTTSTSFIRSSCCAQHKPTASRANGAPEKTIIQQHKPPRSCALRLPIKRIHLIAAPTISSRTRSWGGLGQQQQQQHSNSMPLIYAFAAHGTSVLAEYTPFHGNFNTVALDCLQHLQAGTCWHTGFLLQPAAGVALHPVAHAVVCCSPLLGTQAKTG